MVGNPDLLILTVVLTLMIVLFLTEKISVDLTAIVGLGVLIVSGIVPVKQAFSGYSSPAIITMISTFFLGAALANTGVAERLGKYINSWAGHSETACVAAVMSFAALLSAVMNNIAATVILLPAVTSVSQFSGIPLSRLMIPLAFGTVLGGTTTLIGTPPNIIVSDLLLEYNLDGFAFLDFTPAGIALTGIGIAFMSVFGRKLLPKEAGARRAIRKKESLEKLYELHERLFTLSIPEDSNIDGKTLGELQVGGVLGVQVIAIQREGSRILSPSAEDRVRGGDLLITRGRLSELEQLIRYKGIQLIPLEESELDYSEARSCSFSVPGELAGKSLRQHEFSRRFGITVVSIEREDRLIEREKVQVILKVGDLITVVGSEGNIDSFKKEYSIESETTELIEGLKSTRVFLLKLPEQTRLSGATLSEVRMGELTGLTVLGVFQDSSLKLDIVGDERLQAGELLLVAGNKKLVRRLVELADLEVGTEVEDPSLESPNHALVEVLIAPRSRLIGRSIREISFREKYGFQVLAIWREGRPYRSRLSDFELSFGDALLLQGPRARIPILADNPNFVTLTEKAGAVRRRDRAWVALLGVILMVGLSVSRLQPVHVSAFIAAAFVALFGAISMDRAYRQIEWRVVLLVGALIPIGLAIERSGFALFIARHVIDLVGDYGVYAAFAALVLVSSAISQTLDGALAVILLTPVGVQVAKQLGASPYPFVMGLTLAASVAFLTPFSHKANLLVMGVGGYRVKDYFKVGLPMTLLIFVTLVLVVPLVFPF